MQAIGNSRVEFSSYQLKDVDNMWKDPGATLNSVTRYVAVKFDVSQKALSEAFSISTPVVTQFKSDVY